MRLCEREKKKLKPEPEAHSRQQPPTSRLRCAAELLRLAAPLPLAPHPPTASADRYARSRNSSSLLVVGGQKVRSKECAGSVGKYKALSSSSRRGRRWGERGLLASRRPRLELRLRKIQGRDKQWRQTDKRAPSFHPSRLRDSCLYLLSQAASHCQSGHPLFPALCCPRVSERCRTLLNARDQKKKLLRLVVSR